MWYIFLPTSSSDMYCAWRPLMVFICQFCLGCFKGSLNLLPSIYNMHWTNLHDLLKGKVFSNSNTIGLTDLETMHAITKEFLKAAIIHMTGVPKAAGNWMMKSAKTFQQQRPSDMANSDFQKLFCDRTSGFWNHQQNQQACSKKHFQNIFVWTTSSSVESAD